MHTIRYIVELIRFEIKQHFKSPLIYICLMLLTYNILTEVRPYLAYFPIKSEADILALSQLGAFDLQVERDIQDLPPAVADYFLRLQPEDFADNQKDYNLLKTFGERIRTEKMTYQQMSEYANKNLGHLQPWWKAALSSSKYRLGSVEEVKANIKNSLQGKAITYPVSLLFADRAQVFAVFFLLPIFSLLFFKDQRYRMNEMIYSKKIKPLEYIIAKFLGAFLPSTAFLFLLAMAINSVIYFNHLRAGEPAVFSDMIMQFIVYVIPTLLFSCALTVALSILLRNGLAAIPVCLFYYIFNISEQAFTGREMGSITLYKFIVRIDSLGQMPVFQLIAGNRALYSLLAVLLLIGSAKLWAFRGVGIRRRRAS